MITLSLRSLTGVLAGVSVVLAKHLLRYQHDFLFVCVRVCVRLVSQTTGHYFHTHSRRQTMAACGWLTRPALPFVAFARCLTPCFCARSTEQSVSHLCARELPFHFVLMQFGVAGCEQ